MPYHYHLKLELYASPNPSTPSADLNTIWVPADGETIFDNLPSHPRKTAALASTKRKQKAVETGSGYTRGTRQASVIDCGAPRAAAPDEDEDAPNIVRLSERQWRERTLSFPAPGFSAGLGPKKAARDWRFGPLSVESLDLIDEGGEQPETVMADYMNPAPAVSLGPTLGGAGQATKAKFLPLESKNTELGWGIVHLYREDTDGDAYGLVSEGDVSDGDGETVEGGEDGTILCIPAVPSYLSPSDFLGFVGEKWRGDISHYRMIMTSRMNRYMVLMKFRDGKRAREWRTEFDGKVFNSMEAEICHVTNIKSITVETPGRTRPTLSGSSSAGGMVSNTLKPFPPPTPNLTELPTCPVCLERMDDTAGLMTIICQHVFHCTCLQTWKGSGCPVCRATNPSLVESPSASDPYDPSNPYSQPFGHGITNLCTVCDCADDLWICLICGNVGCGRYKGGHAKDHWKETAHSFSLELETQHVWDYAGDTWVHRLLRDKGDGKVVELPGRTRSGAGPNGNEDVVPREKLESMSREYTHLLTSQLESQRVYFEEMVSKAADKAAKASAAAESAASQAAQALAELRSLRTEHDALIKTTLPGLEREAERERKRADKSTELARNLGKSVQEEKKVSEGLMQRVGHVNKELETMKGKVEELARENEELKEMNRDLTMFISGQEKLKEMEEEGKVAQGELEEGSVSLPERRKPRGKGKGRG
ncbi:uncharacterized protein E0L32_001373 [Thyridium curvatum]|uniref:Uncharacterized protein n=1 Tax=Thyridium curvatum TaxID=1093900 RepID=A0A507ATZ6_9PEZI|nr:uncharacterized protein E0L32_001373 [Thyridium curvatum]TPX10176.1 hypothetical protein E0L32_001373 [Thyridium curvatum]